MKNLRIYSCDKQIPKQKIHHFIKFILEDFQLSLISLELNFISSYKIREINKNYLYHDYSTDIITFNYAENKSVIDGEIFISVEDAAGNAKKYRVKYIEEIGRLIVHGILHLIGFDDSTATQRKKMKNQENRLLKKYKFILLR